MPKKLVEAPASNWIIEDMGWVVRKHSVSSNLHTNIVLLGNKQNTKLPTFSIKIISKQVSRA